MKKSNYAFMAAIGKWQGDIILSRKVKNEGGKLTNYQNQEKCKIYQ